MSKNKENKEKISENTVNDTTIDDNFGKIIKYVVIVIILLGILFVFNPILNIKTGEIGIQESVITKEISIYRTPGVFFTNPFAKTTKLPSVNQKIVYSQNNTLQKEIDNKNKKQQEITLYGKGKQIEIYKQEKPIKTVLKGGYNIEVELTLAYKIKNDKESLIKIYKEAQNQYVEGILLPIIETTVSDIFAKYSFSDLIEVSSEDLTLDGTKDNNETKSTIRNEINQKIKEVLDAKGFHLISFNLGQVIYSDVLKAKIEDIFQKQKELVELSITKQKTGIEGEIIDENNKNNSKKNEAIIKLIKKLKEENISIDEYNKVKMIKIVEKQWNGNIIPDNVSNLLDNNN